MKKHIALIVAIILLAGGSFVTERWFVQTYNADQQTAVTFSAETRGTVLEVMQTRAEKGEFSFSGRDFPGLGFFVEEINGKRNANGYYWILYVNGTSSQTGVSQTVLSAGDVIEWKYEKGY